MANIKNIKVTIGLVLVVALLALIGATSWYTVDESEQALILTFGKAEEPVTEPGLKFKLPWPIQEVYKVSKETYSLQFGYKEVDGKVVSENIKDTKMITGDENIVLADLVVQYKITDPEKYLFNVDDPEAILYDATSASYGVLSAHENRRCFDIGKGGY